MLHPFGRHGQWYLPLWLYAAEGKTFAMQVNGKKTQNFQKCNDMQSSVECDINGILKV